MTDAEVAETTEASTSYYRLLRRLWSRAGPRAGSNPVLHVSPAPSQAYRAQFTVTTACWSGVLVRAGTGTALEESFAVVRGPVGWDRALLVRIARSNTVNPKMAIGGDDNVDERHSTSFSTGPSLPALPVAGQSCG